ncbi:hypothetical protein SAMN05443668_105335 [Cryptosporangium aurantiacum]|uniref:PH domain-containing protein n=2 Tax=Cryptosporangium aurantiacum TaxID=134849 RepID=A0A1M7QTE8_9ACTN|nr:hypothetical protein SAMN05443668_105335 [Cryptosporangium aurantiacum]
MVTAVRQTRLLAVVAGLVVFGLVLSTSFLADELSLWLALLPFVVAAALVWGWWNLTERQSRNAPKTFLLGTFRQRPAFATANSILSMQPLPMFLVGTQLVTMESLDWSFRWFSAVFALLILGPWIASIVQPSGLRLTSEAIICRWILRRRVIPWSTLYPGEGSVHQDRVGGVWVLADHTVPQHRSDRIPGRPQGPRGYHWIRTSASSRTVIDPTFLERAIAYYHLDPGERALIGTADGLRALRADEK